MQPLTSRLYIKTTLVFMAILFSFSIISIGETKAAGKINYRLKWHFNASVVGDLYADVHDKFLNAGLDVTVKAGGVGLNAIRELELNDAQFGVASADQVIRAREKGSPVVVIAQLFQINPLQWIYRSDGLSIKSLQDLKGKTLGVTFGGNDESIMITLLAKGGISEKEVRLYSVRRDFTPFYQRKVDIWPVYRNTQGIMIAGKLTAAGEEVDFFVPGEFGVKFVANSVITSERMIKEHPGTVKKFITALLEGWEQSLDPANEQKTMKTLAQFENDKPLDILKKQLNATRKLVKPSSDLKIGSIDVEAWKQTEAIMLKQKLIKKPVFVEKVLKSY